MDSRQILNADEIEDGQSYVAAGTENMHQCQYGHALPRLQVGTARKKGEEQEEEESAEAQQEEGYKAPKVLPPLNSLRETESQRVLHTHRSCQNDQPDCDHFVLVNVEAKSGEPQVVTMVSQVTEEAAIKIQAGCRGFLVRRERKRKEEAAKKIQAGFRGYHTRKQLKEEKVVVVPRNATFAVSKGPEDESQAQAALKIQAGYRGFKVRKQIKEERAKMNQAAAKIQAGFRGYAVRKGKKQKSSAPSSPKLLEPADKETGVEEQAATKIQATFRGFKTRKQLKVRRNEPDQNKENRFDEKSNQAATRIQANYRGYKVRKNMNNRKEKRSQPPTPQEGSRQVTREQSRVMSTEKSFNSAETHKAASESLGEQGEASFLLAEE